MVETANMLCYCFVYGRGYICRRIASAPGFGNECRGNSYKHQFCRFGGGLGYQPSLADAIILGTLLTFDDMTQIFNNF